LNHEFKRLICSWFVSKYEVSRFAEFGSANALLNQTSTLNAFAPGAGGLRGWGVFLIAEKSALALGAASVLTGPGETRGGAVLGGGGGPAGGGGAAGAKEVINQKKSVIKKCILKYMYIKIKIK
jgi:hypothetical protein